MLWALLKHFTVELQTWTRDENLPSQLLGNLIESLTELTV